MLMRPLANSVLCLSVTTLRIKVISICRCRLLSDGSTNCRPRLLEPVSRLQAFGSWNLTKNRVTPVSLEMSGNLEF